MMKRAASPLPGLVSAHRAAEETGIPYHSLRDLARRGGLPAVRLNRAWYFDRDDLTRLVESAKATLGRQQSR